MSPIRAIRPPTVGRRSTAFEGRTTERSPARLALGHAASFGVILLGASMFLAGAPAYAAQGPVGLGTAGSFAVLAGSGITNTGPTTITGDVGTFPTSSETGFGSITMTGTNHDGDAVTQGAKNDLVSAYNDAAGRNPVTNLPVELGGSTLSAGVYTSPTFGLTGTLTLDAKGNPNAEFIFQAGSTVITASNSRVLLINGADACNVVWQVGSSATFNTGTQFVGDVLAYRSITAETGATFQGRLLARGGAVTLDTNTITNATCATPAAAGTTTTTVAVTPKKTATTTPVTVGRTGTATPTPSAAPAGGPGTTPGSGTPGSGPVPNGTTPVSSGPPAGTPGGPPAATPSPPSAPPALPLTGAPIVRLLTLALSLLALGAVSLVGSGTLRLRPLRSSS